MKYKNVTEKLIIMNLNGEFQNIEPNECIELPEYIGNRQEGLVEVVVKKVIVQPIKKKIVQEVDLKKLTKDGLNDYAAKLDYNDINNTMKKSEMIKKILEYQNEK